MTAEAREEAYDESLVFVKEKRLAWTLSKTERLLSRGGTIVAKKDKIYIIDHR